MPEEVNEIKALMSDIKSDNDNVVVGILAHKEVVVCTSGVGKVNASYTTTKLLMEYDVEMVINIGSAGGLQVDQKVGDLVIANKLQYHDFDIGEEYLNDPRFIFYSNEKLNKILEQTIHSLDMTYHYGLMVSGDQFIVKTNPAFANIQSKFPKAQCTEMEATAIAHVCSRFDVPFVVMRALSDVTYENEDQMQFEEFLPLAAKNSAKICEAFISQLNDEN